MAPDKVRRPIVQEQSRKIEGQVGRPMGFGKKGPGQIGDMLRNERLELVAFTQA
jgi:hypothetical protein